MLIDLYLDRHPSTGGDPVMRESVLYTLLPFS